MTVSPNSLDNLNFIWDPNVPKNSDIPGELTGLKTERNFEDYLNFLEEMAPYKNDKVENGLLRDTVFEL